MVKNNRLLLVLFVFLISFQQPVPSFSKIPRAGRSRHSTTPWHNNRPPNWERIWSRRTENSHRSRRTEKRKKIIRWGKYIERMLTSTDAEKQIEAIDSIEENLAHGLIFAIQSKEKNVKKRAENAIKLLFPNGRLWSLILGKQKTADMEINPYEIAYDTEIIKIMLKSMDAEKQIEAIDSIEEKIKNNTIYQDTKKGEKLYSIIQENLAHGLIFAIQSKEKNVKKRAENAIKLLIHSEKSNIFPKRLHQLRMLDFKNPLAIFYLKDALADPVSLIRAEAIQLIGKHPSGKEAIVEIQHATSDQSIEVRKEALQFLERFDHKKNALKEAIIQGIKDQNWSIRQQSLEFIRSIKFNDKEFSQQLLPHLKTFLRDPNEKVQRAAINAIGCFGTLARHVVPCLTPYLYSKNPWVRFDAKIAIAKLQGSHPCSTNNLPASQPSSRPTSLFTSQPSSRTTSFSTSRPSSRLTNIPAFTPATYPSQNTFVH